MATILLIEDDDSFRDTLAACLRLEKFSVLTARDGSAGLALARTQSPALLLCDVGLPGCNGHRVLAELRADPRTAQLPVIFLTAHGQHDDIRAGMNLGADDYLVKPVELDDVLAAVRARLRRATMPRPAPTPETLRALGLTAREAEILFWIAQGKANSEIATILGMNLPTVKKHAHHILEKLGVENRTSAANIANSRLR